MKTENNGNFGNLEISDHSGRYGMGCRISSGSGSIRGRRSGNYRSGKRSPEWVRDQIQKAKKMTDKPFGVNIMLMSPYADEIAKVIVEEKVKVVTTGAGSPEKYMQMWKEADVKVIPVVASVALAKRMERCHADAVVAEGTEAGGHIGEASTMTLVPQVVDAVKFLSLRQEELQTEEGLRLHLCSEQKEFRWERHFIVNRGNVRFMKNYKK